MKRPRRGDGARLLEDLRLAKQWSQEALAEASGLHRTYVVGVERGKVAPTLDRIVGIAFALDVEPADLLPPSGRVR